MAQNRSTAVMQRRRPTPPDALEYFPTQPWATRAACEFLLSIGEPLQHLSCWEPTAGEMHMARPLAEYFGTVHASDIYPYQPDLALFDFLSSDPGPSASWLFMNPPFDPARQFIEKGLQRTRRGLAVIARIAFLEGQGRYREIYSQRPPAYTLVYTERVPMLEGRLIRDGALDPFNIDPKTGKPRKASSATSYVCLIWIHGQTDTRTRWTGICRDRLIRDGDYPDYAEQWAKIAGDDGGLFDGA